ncbi:MAG: penicillin-binding protein 1A [Burkholderiaceae bacterium]|nr:penicillin-binding protein 1A [Polynucleobacter sp.]MCF8187912.1 penicillin-binding protein 1A [Sulfuritalea sp.]
MNSNAPEGNSPASPRRDRLPAPIKLALSIFGVLTGLAVIGILLVSFMMMMAYPNLPDIDSLATYQPKMPLRVFSADNMLIGEFGEERRSLVRYKDIPKVMKQAVLAIEDDRFYEHGGVDYWGILRAALHNAMGGSRQGASTITQQVARNFFLSSEQTVKRKLYEVLLAWKIEKNLTKDQILELYMNQIYLGQRSYGFASAAQIYFGKKLHDITIAEAAMLAGLPKAPSANNPVVNPKRARARQQYILQRMHDLGYITTAQYEQARDEQLKIKMDSNEFGVHAEYVAEMARQMVYDQFKEETYTRGLNVFTTITKADQDAAYLALRRGVLDYEKRQVYRGPEGYMDIPADKGEAEASIESELAEHPDSDGIVAAVVLTATPKSVRALLASGEEITIQDAGLGMATSALTDKTPANRRIRRGAIIRVMQEGNGWAIIQLPEVESAFVSASAEDGAIRALVGGFDFNRNKFNHVTQAWRQPGSSFKPFIYSASLEKGLSPGTVINDAPITYDASQTGSQAWEPKNYDNKYEGPMSMRKGLSKSKNMISIRILDRIGPAYAQEYVTRFGFDPEKNPPYLTLALGAGAVTPLQLAGAYAVFANGGYKINPYLISKITDNNGKTLFQVTPEKAGDENLRIIDARNAFLIDSMLKDVIKHGTAMRALSLKRSDIAGKTGTTNDSIDAWFAGYHPKLVGVAWIGFDKPKNLGNRETGGGLALPIWIGYMQKALPGIATVERETPTGITITGGDYIYSENSDTGGVGSLGISPPSESKPPPEKTEEGQKSELF